MSDLTSKDLDILSLDWSSLSESDKLQIITEHVNYVDMSRRAVSAAGSYTSNIRSLTLMMFVTLVCIINSIENRTIVLSIIGLQFIKTVFSRLFEVSIVSALEIEKKKLSEFIMKKVEKNKDA